MQNKVTFYLAIATTLAFGTFGVMGALYSEIIKEAWERSGKLIAIDFLIMLVSASWTIHFFMAAGSVIEKEEKK